MYFLTCCLLAIRSSLLVVVDVMLCLLDELHASRGLCSALYFWYSLMLLTPVQGSVQSFVVLVVLFLIVILAFGRLLLVTLRSLLVLKNLFLAAAAVRTRISIYRSIDQSINHSTDPSINQSIDRTINQSIEHRHHRRRHHDDRRHHHPCRHHRCHRRADDGEDDIIVVITS